MKSYVALAKHVLVVAVDDESGEWAAYIDAVKGRNHETESEEVARTGTKLPKEIAEILFPAWKNLRWRYLKEPE
jgi:hypothetical protein